jgi:hypothetical protein
MKIFGYKDEGLDPENVRPVELAEITLQADPAELRKIATFLNTCADGMEARGRDWEHEHLSDRVKEFENSPHFVVFNPEAT